MKYVAETNGLSFDIDVKLVTVGPVSELYDYFEIYPNKTLYGALLCTKE